MGQLKRGLKTGAVMKWKIYEAFRRISLTVRSAMNAVIKIYWCCQVVGSTTTTNAAINRSRNLFRQVTMTRQNVQCALTSGQDKIRYAGKS